MRAGEDDPTCLRPVPVGADTDDASRSVCGGILKSATISFGQSLVPEDLMRAEEAASRCDLLLAVGSTLGVFPAAGLVPVAVRHGAVVVIVNGGPTEMDDFADVVVRGSISELLQALTASLAQVERSQRHWRAMPARHRHRLPRFRRTGEGLPLAAIALTAPIDTGLGAHARRYILRLSTGLEREPPDAHDGPQSDRRRGNGLYHLACATVGHAGRLSGGAGGSLIRHTYDHVMPLLVPSRSEGEHEEMLRDPRR